jgi:hypothetical protein
MPLWGGGEAAKRELVVEEAGFDVVGVVREQSTERDRESIYTWGKRIIREGRHRCECVMGRNVVWMYDGYRCDGLFYAAINLSLREPPLDLH